MLTHNNFLYKEFKDLIPNAKDFLAYLDEKQELSTTGGKRKRTPFVYNENAEKTFARLTSAEVEILEELVNQSDREIHNKSPNAYINQDIQTELMFIWKQMNITKGKNDIYCRRLYLDYLLWVAIKESCLDLEMFLTTTLKVDNRLLFLKEFVEYDDYELDVRSADVVKDLKPYPSRKKPEKLQVRFKTIVSTIPALQVTHENSSVEDIEEKKNSPTSDLVKEPTISETTLTSDLVKEPTVSKTTLWDHDEKDILKSLEAKVFETQDEVFTEDFSPINYSSSRPSVKNFRLIGKNIHGINIADFLNTEIFDIVFALDCIKVEVKSDQENQKPMYQYTSTDKPSYYLSKDYEQEYLKQFYAEAIRLGERELAALVLLFGANEQEATLLRQEHIDILLFYSLRSLQPSLIDLARNMHGDENFNSLRNPVSSFLPKQSELYQFLQCHRKLQEEYERLTIPRQLLSLDEYKYYLAHTALPQYGKSAKRSLYATPAATFLSGGITIGLMFFGVIAAFFPWIWAVTAAVLLIGFAMNRYAAYKEKQCARKISQVENQIKALKQRKKDIESITHIPQSKLISKKAPSPITKNPSHKTQIDSKGTFLTTSEERKEYNTKVAETASKNPNTSFNKTLKKLLKQEKKPIDKRVNNKKRYISSSASTIQKKSFLDIEFTSKFKSTLVKRISELKQNKSDFIKELRINNTNFVIIKCATSDAEPRYYLMKMNAEVINSTYVVIRQALQLNPETGEPILKRQLSDSNVSHLAVPEVFAVKIFSALQRDNDVKKVETEAKICGYFSRTDYLNGNHQQYIISPWCPGRPLVIGNFELNPDVAALSFAEKIHLIRQLEEKFDSMHHADAKHTRPAILHLDIKGSNIHVDVRNETEMFMENGQVIVVPKKITEVHPLDFGEAVELPEEEESVSVGFRGTPFMVAPEIISNLKEDKASEQTIRASNNTGFAGIRTDGYALSILEDIILGASKSCDHRKEGLCGIPNTTNDTVNLQDFRFQQEKSYDQTGMFAFLENKPSGAGFQLNFSDAFDPISAADVDTIILRFIKLFSERRRHSNYHLRPEPGEALLFFKTLDELCQDNAKIEETCAYLQNKQIIYFTKLLLLTDGQWNNAVANLEFNFENTQVVDACKHLINNYFETTPLDIEKFVEEFPKLQVCSDSMYLPATSQVLDSTPEHDHKHTHSLRG